MVWYKEIKTPETQNLVVKRETLAEFKKFCKEEFLGSSRTLYNDFERAVESNIFLKDFESHDKEYLKMILGLLKQLEKDFNKENVEMLLSTERLSNPPSIILSGDECNYFVLKKACEYVVMLQPDRSNSFTWIEVIKDVKVITIPYYISKEFLDILNKTRDKIRALVDILDDIAQEEEDLELTILVKPLMLTKLVLEIQTDKRELFISLINQGVIHPAMKIPKSQSVSFTSDIFLEHLMEKPLKSTTWFVRESILTGDDWIDYEKMYEKYLGFYEKIIKPLGENNQKTFSDKIKIYEENFEAIRIKYTRAEIIKTQNMYPESFLADGSDSSDNFKI